MQIYIYILLNISPIRILWDLNNPCVTDDIYIYLYVFYKIGLLKNFTISFPINFQPGGLQLFKTEIPAQVFPVTFAEFLRKSIL